MHEDKLIKRIEQGDITAADELIEVYYPEILKYCIWHLLKYVVYQFYNSQFVGSRNFQFYELNNNELWADWFKNQSASFYIKGCSNKGFIV